MYQPNQATTEIGRMRAEEMRVRAERYRTIQKAKQHKKAESEEEEESLSHSRTFVYRRALGIVGLSALMILAFAATALAMPADAPSGVDGNGEAFVTQPQVREGPPSVWEASADVPTRSEIQQVVPAPIGGQDRAETQHLVPGAFGGQERAAIQHVGESDQPSTFDPAPGVTSSSGIELEMVLLLTAIMALGSAGALLWFRRETAKQSV